MIAIAWLNLGQKMSFLYRFVLMKAWFIFKIFFRFKVYGAKKNFYKGGAIIASNHVSYLDPPILSIGWPEPVHFLARKSLFRNFLFGKFISALNAHPVAGGAKDVAVFRMVTDLLKEGKKVILFPEGTRSKDGELGPVKPGITLFLAKTGAAVVPAYIEGAAAAWPKGSKFPKLFTKIRVVYGSPILWSDFSSLDRKEVQEAFATRFREAVLGLKKWLENGAVGNPP